MAKGLNLDADLFPAVVGFQSRKAAQIAAYFACKQNAGKAAGRIEKLKLTKLFYLAERESIKSCGYPMLFDELYSLPHGPICSGVLNGIDGRIDNANWAQFITRNGNEVIAVKNFNRDELDEISDFDIGCLDRVWKQFGSMTSAGVRNYTHAHCPEYTEVKAGRIPISYLELYKALEHPEADAFASEIEAYRKREALFA